MAAPGMALLLSFLYIAAVVAAGEWLRRRAGLPDHLARKLIHLGAGLWVFPTLLLFPSRWWALLPPLAAVAGNYAIQRWRLVPAMGGEPGSWGTVWFPLSLALLLALFWTRPLVILAGMVPLTVGDPAAALVGRRLGWGRYGEKSLAGTLAMFAVSWAALWASFLWLGALPGGGAVPWGGAVPGGGAGAWALVLAAAAALLEAAGRRGTDNLLVPLGAAAASLGLLALAAAAPPGAGPVAPLALGVALSAAIAAVAYWRGALAPTGVLGAVLTGTLVFGLGGWAPGVALVYFFASSSLLSHSRSQRKQAAAAGYAKGARRDLGQALANGGVAAALCVAAAATGEARWLGAAVGALAAACADTWATELGALAPAPPRLITSLRAVPVGTSGAVSPLGILAAAAGGLSTGLAAALAGLWPGAAGPLVLAAGVAGLAGGLGDSLLGATLQGIYRCPACGRETERDRHCGRPAPLARGVPWLGNDLVNLLATAVGAGVLYGLQ